MIVAYQRLEATMLAERRRVVVTSDVQAWVRGLLAALRRREASLTFEVALVSRRLELKRGTIATSSGRC